MQVGLIFMVTKEQWVPFCPLFGLMVKSVLHMVLKVRVICVQFWKLRLYSIVGCPGSYLNIKGFVVLFWIVIKVISQVCVRLRRSCDLKKYFSGAILKEINEHKKTRSLIARYCICADGY